MTSPIIKIFSIIIGLLTLYALPCFLAHYLDFGWKFSSGEWLHKDFSIVKKLRSSLFQKVLIGFILVIVIYAGLSEVLATIPADWGKVSGKGQFQPYRRILAVVLAVLVGIITMYAFSLAETYYTDQKKAIKNDKDSSF